MDAVGDDVAVTVPDKVVEALGLSELVTVAETEHDGVTDEVALAVPVADAVTDTVPVLVVVSVADNVLV